MIEISDVIAREILDSRGNPTLEVEVFAGEISARAAVPSGASTGTREAVELRDGDGRYHGKGVLKAVSNVENIIAPEIIGMDVFDQRGLDMLLIDLDGTKNKENLGANSILGVSMAVARLAAQFSNSPLYQYLGGRNAHVLPVPFMNVINGGQHAGNSLSIQEHMIAPVGAVNLSEAVMMGSEIYHTLKQVLMEKYGRSAINVGDEGGFAPPMQDIKEPFDAIIEAIERSGYSGKVKIAIDSAATNFWNDDGTYTVQGRKYRAGELLDIYADLVDTYPIIAIEDGFAEDDWESFREMTMRLGSRIQIIGDDIFVTNPEYIERGIREGTANSVLIKLNQIGTVTETLEAVEMVHRGGLRTLISHRSGETADTFIADLAVAVNSGQIKSGAPCRVDRVEKYNRLMRIEEELGYTGSYGL